MVRPELSNFIVAPGAKSFAPSRWVILLMISGWHPDSATFKWVTSRAYISEAPAKTVCCHIFHALPLFSCLCIYFSRKNSQVSASSQVKGHTRVFFVSLWPRRDPVGSSNRMIWLLTLSHIFKILARLVSSWYIRP